MTVFLYNYIGLSVEAHVCTVIINIFDAYCPIVKCALTTSIALSTVMYNVHHKKQQNQSNIYALQTSSLCCLLFKLGLDAQIVVHVVSGADEDGGAVMDGLGLDVEGGDVAVARLAPGLLNQVGHRTALVEQTELGGRGGRGQASWGGGTVEVI